MRFVLQINLSTNNWVSRGMSRASIPGIPVVSKPFQRHSCLDLWNHLGDCYNYFQSSGFLLSKTLVQTKGWVGTFGNGRTLTFVPTFTALSKTAASAGWTQSQHSEIIWQSDPIWGFSTHYFIGHPVIQPWASVTCPLNFNSYKVFSLVPKIKDKTIAIMKE